MAPPEGPRPIGPEDPSLPEPEAIARALGCRPQAIARSGKRACITTPLPDPLAVGAGNALLVGGWMAPPPPDGRAALLVDGSPRPLGVARCGGAGLWWTTLVVPPVARGGELPLALRVAGEAEELPLGRLRVEPAVGTAAAGAAIGRALAAARGSGRPLIAICMAAYEPPIELFARQLASIREQTREGWVCLICDDGSGEAKLEAMRGKVGGDPRFALVSGLPRLGFYANFERVLGMVPAEAELVALADQDDRWHPRKLESLERALGAAELAYGDMRVVGEDGRVVSGTYWTQRRNNYRDFTSLLVGNTVTGSASLFRPSVLERALPFPPRRGRAYHDHWIALNALAGGGIAYLDRPIQDYVQHGGAAQGHAEANAGAAQLRPSVLLRLAAHGLAALAGRDPGGGWAERYFGMYSRTLIWARVLLMRTPGLRPAHRRTLERVLRSGRRPSSWAWLAGRSLRPLWGANEAFGRELIVLSSALWGLALAARSRLWGRRRGAYPESADSPKAAS